MKSKNFITETEEDLLKFGVDTINLYVKLSNKESIQDIDDYDFISYKNGNSKAKKLHRTITLKSSRLKKNKSYLMNTLSEEIAKESKIIFEDVTLEVFSLGIGYAIRRNLDETINDVFIRADQSMYKNKVQGKSNA